MIVEREYRRRDCAVAVREGTVVSRRVVRAA